MERKIQQNRFDELVNGTGTRYAVILDAIRENLKTEILTPYGCIAFYNYKIETGEMLMKVFPFKPEVVSKNFPDSLEIRSAALERINADRPYEKMHHLKNFRRKFTTTSHISLSIPIEEILTHDKKKINDTTWPDFVSNTKIDNNVFDNLFFISGHQDFHIYPLPVLSSPCMLLIIPSGETMKSPDNVAIKIRESIDFYLYNRLLNEVSKDLKPGQIADKKELIKRFLIELSQVAIPIKYLFDGNEYKCFDWYGNWETDSCATLELNLAGEAVEIFMPTFCWHTGEMLHQLPHYRVKEKQVRETIQNIFQLVYGYWQTINSKKLLVQSEISPLITELRESVVHMKAMKTKVEERISEQTHKVDMLSKLVVELGADMSQPWENEFYSTKKADGTLVWKIRYNGDNVVEGASDKGFEGLHVIFSNPHTEIDVSVLGADSRYLQQQINDPDIEAVLNSYKSEITRIEQLVKKGGLSFDEYGTKIYAENLAGYINSCKDLNHSRSYTEEMKKLTFAKARLKACMDNDAYDKYEKQLDAIAKQSKPASMPKKLQDGILNPIRQLVNRLKEEQGGILAPLLEPPILKIGVKSFFKPTMDLEVIWRFSKSDEIPD